MNDKQIPLKKLMAAIDEYGWCRKATGMQMDKIATCCEQGMDIDVLAIMIWLLCENVTEETIEKCLHGIWMSL